MVSAPSGTCPVCLDSDVQIFLERTNVPAFANVLFKYRTDAINVERGDMRLSVCIRCGFVFNAAFNPGKTRYGAQYDNNQTCSGEFTAYLNDHIENIVRRPGLRNSTIVEVGCGSGWFLEHLVAAVDGSRGFGFDPAYRGPRESLGGRIRYEQRYFEAGDAALQADIVVCRHVIEHVADPVSLLHSVRAALTPSRQPRVFFETPCLEWILDRQVIWDFFYEHCSYFSESSMRTAFDRAGFEVERVDRVFGDQYLWLEAVPGAVGTTPTMKAGRVPALAKRFAESEAQLVARLVSDVRRLHDTGKVAVWGVGAKGVTFLNLIDPRGLLIDCAVDINPQKQHRFVGGTGHPVIAVGELVERGIASALLMNPNYRNENERLLAEARARVKLVG